MKNMRSDNIKIVIACDKYKGNLSAIEVCKIIQKAINELDPSVDTVVSPMADGGDGTVKTLVESLNGEYIDLEVKDPVGEKIQSYLGLIDNGKTAVIEMSLASGLAIVPKEKRNPLFTTSYGTGELIKKALDLSCKKIIIGIGGSATNDAGIGALKALGVKFLDIHNKELDAYGSDLLKINSINMSGISPEIKNTEIFIACDVSNPLYGKEGAAYVYGAQKGADARSIEILDRGLRNFSEVVKKQFGKDISVIEGAGAAGGMGAGFSMFLNARLEPGTDLVILATKLEEKIRDADLVISGEGAMDFQTFYGKSPYGVAKLCSKYGINIITINGSVNIDYSKVEKNKINLFKGNFDIISRALNLEEALINSKEFLYSSSKEILKFYLSTIKYLK